MSPESAFSLLVASQFAIMAFGWAAATAYERFPRAVSLAAALIPGAGFVAIWIAGCGWLLEWPLQRKLVPAGVILLAVGFATCGLLVARAKRDRPADLTEWMRFLLPYLGACWLLYFVIGSIAAFAMIATAPPGSVR